MMRNSMVIQSILKVIIELIREIKVKFDPDMQTLSYETIIQIFDKRQIAKGVRKLKADFKAKRRQCLLQKKEDAYKKIVLHYKKLIEAKLESNLSTIARRVIPFSSNSFTATTHYAAN